MRAPRASVRVKLSQSTAASAAASSATGAGGLHPIGLTLVRLGAASAAAVAEAAARGAQLRTLALKEDDEVLVLGPFQVRATPCATVTANRNKDLSTRILLLCHDLPHHSILSAHPSFPISTRQRAASVVADVAALVAGAGTEGSMLLIVPSTDVPGAHAEFTLSIQVLCHVECIFFLCMGGVE